MGEPKVESSKLVPNSQWVLTRGSVGPNKHSNQLPTCCTQGTLLNQWVVVREVGCVEWAKQRERSQDSSRGVVSIGMGIGKADQLHSSQVGELGCSLDPVSLFVELLRTLNRWSWRTARLDSSSTPQSTVEIGSQWLIAFAAPLPN